MSLPFQMMKLEFEVTGKHLRAPFCEWDLCGSVHVITCVEWQGLYIEYIFDAFAKYLYI